MSIESGPNWEILLQDIKNKKKSTERELYYAVDRLLDEIRSGENFLTYLDPILEQLVPLVKEPSWHLVQSVLFGLCAIVENLIPFALSQPETKQSLIQKMTLWLNRGGMWYEILLHGMKNKKREVRDATAQFLGSISLFFSSIFKSTLSTDRNNKSDDNIPSEITLHPLLPIIQVLLQIGGSPITIPESKTQPTESTKISETMDSYETLEGSMMLTGYLLYKMSTRHIPAIYHKALVAMLEKNTSFENNQDHSRYIRLQAIRALDRAVRSGCVVYEQKDSQERDDEYLFKNVILTRLNDNNIDVRKATAALFTSWALSFVDKQPTLFISSVHNLLDYFISGKTTRWEHRHGLVYAFYLMCQSPLLINALPLSTIQMLIESLVTQIKFTHPESKDPPSVTVVSNSTALLALVELFITLYRLYLERERPDDDINALSDMIQRLTLQGKETTTPTSVTTQTKQTEYLINWIFTEKVLPLLHLSLGSTLDLQIDCGVRGVYRLATCLPLSFLQSHIVPLICRVFKNKFHASHPIQEQANRTWRVVVGGNNLTDEEFSHRENEFLRIHHITLLDFLLNDTELPNPDIREAAFKALENLFLHPALTSLTDNNNNNNTIVKSPYLEKVFQSVITELKGVHAEKGGKGTQEYPQAASLKALAAYCKLLSLHNIPLQESTIETLFRIISELLRSVSTLIVPACIDALVTLVRLNNYPHLLNIQDAVAGQVWALSYLESDYTIRMSALSHRMALLVHQVPSASAVLSNLVNFGFKEDVEIELRQAIVEFVRAIFSFDSSLDLSFDENAIFTAMNILGHALIDIDNRDEELFTILSLRTLSLLLVHPIAQKVIPMNEKIQRNLKMIVSFLFYILLDMVDDFNVETFPEPSKDKNGDEENNDDESGSDDDSNEESELPAPCPLPLKNRLLETIETTSISPSKPTQKKNKSEVTQYAMKQMIYYSKIQTVLWLIVKSFPLLSQETANTFAEFLHNILSKTLKTLTEWNASSHAQLFVFHILYSSLQSLSHIHSSLKSLCEELKKNLGVVTIDTNVLHESLKYFHSIIETRSTSIVSDFSKYSQLLTALNTFSVFTQVENISFKEDTIPDNTIETILKVANWVQTLPVSHGSDILFKRLAVQRALNAARDCCFLNKATVLNTKQVFDVLYLITQIISSCSDVVEDTTEEGENEIVALEGQASASQTQQEIWRQFTNRRIASQQLLMDVNHFAMILFDEIWNRLDDDHTINQLIQQITTPLHFTKDDDQESESENENHDDHDTKNQIHFSLLENVTTSHRVSKIPILTRQRLAKQCLQYLTSDEAFDDEATFLSIVRILRGLAQSWTKEDVTLFSGHLNTLLQIIATKKELLDINEGLALVDLFIVCAKLVLIWSKTDPAREKFLQQLVDNMFNEDIEETTRSQFEIVVTQLARDIRPEILNLPNPTRVESVLINEGFKT